MSEGFDDEPTLSVERLVAMEDTMPHGEYIKTLGRYAPELAAQVRLLRERIGSPIPPMTFD